MENLSFSKLKKSSTTGNNSANRLAPFILFTFTRFNILHHVYFLITFLQEILQIIGEVGTGLVEMRSKGKIHGGIQSDTIYIFAKKHYKLGFVHYYLSTVTSNSFTGDLDLSMGISTLVPILQNKQRSTFVFFYFMFPSHTYIFSGYNAPEVVNTQPFASLSSF